MSVAKYKIFPDREKDNYQVTLSSLTGSHGSLREELGNAIVKKANDTGKPLCLLVSGGLDSQMLLLSARERKVPFIAIHIAAAYKGQLVSKRCLEQTEVFSKRHGFTVETVEVELDKLLLKYPMIPTMNLIRYRIPYMKTHSVIGLGGDVFHHGFKGRSNYTVQSYLHNDVSAWVYKEYGLDVDFHFYQYTPELYYGYLYHPLSKIGELFLKDNPGISPEENRMIKFMYHYHEFGDELIYYNKRTGTEEYPDVLRRFDNRIWEMTSHTSWVRFSEEDTLKLYRNEVASITRSSTVDPVILKHAIPPKDLLRI